MDWRGTEANCAYPSSQTLPAGSHAERRAATDESTGLFRPCLMRRRVRGALGPNFGLTIRERRREHLSPLGDGQPFHVDLTHGAAGESWQ
eukprot:6180205-Pleurochrysis_carterae.AAC.3